MRYEEVSKDVIGVSNQIIKEKFPALKDAKIKYLFDTKMAMKEGMIILGYCRKTNDLIRHLTKDEAETYEGFDFIITLDKEAWGVMGEKDRIRLVRHELRHAVYLKSEEEGEENTCYILPHDLSDFSAEVEINTDDPIWAQRISGIIEVIYADKKDEEKENKKSKKAEAPPKAAPQEDQPKKSYVIRRKK